MASIKIPYDVNIPDLRQTFLREILPQSIDTLTEDEDPNWGKMSSQHMIEHLILSFQMSTNKLVVECDTPEGKRAKLQLFLNSNQPMPKGFKNPVTGSKLLDLEYSHLDEAKVQLKEEILYYLDYYKDNPDVSHVHPVFGKLGTELWQKFHFKHCFHHFTQFSVIEEK